MLGHGPGVYNGFDESYISSGYIFQFQSVKESFRTFDKLVSFGYNETEGGELVMKRKKRYLLLDSFEWRLAIVGMNLFRNNLLRAGKPTEDVATLLLKLINAKAKRRE